MLSVRFAARTGPPMVLHYGNDLAVPGLGYRFSKIELRNAGFDATLCPPWGRNAKDFAELKGGLLPHPPSPLALRTKVHDCYIRHCSPCFLASLRKTIGFALRGMAAVRER